MPTLEPRLAGLTNSGIGSFASRPSRTPARLRVHADRRGQHAAADVGQVGELEQALDGAVLAVGTVQDREDDVEAHALDDGALAVAALERRLAVAGAIGGAVDAEERLVARPGHQ